MNHIHNINQLDLSTLHRTDINLYPLFISIFEQKSISKSAQLLCISQSAASHALQRLRQHLNDDLFIRLGSKMQPTPFAEQIYPLIKNALITIQHISQQNISFDPQQIQNLKIAIHDEIEPLIFPKLVQHFQSLNLKIQCISMKLDRKTIAADLASQQIDFVIDLEQNYGEKIQFKTLVQDKFMVCTQLNHMDKHLYLSSSHIGVSSRRTGVLIEDIYLNKKKFTREIILRCQHYSTALQILQHQSNLVLTIPKSVLVNLQMYSQLNIFEFPFDTPQMNMGIYWHYNLNENMRHNFLKNEIIHIFA